LKVDLRAVPLTREQLEILETKEANATTYCSDLGIGEIT
jgi:hypothetical protein